jgi:hypothetical protein
MRDFQYQVNLLNPTRVYRMNSSGYHGMTDYANPTESTSTTMTVTGANGLDAVNNPGAQNGYLLDQCRQKATLNFTGGHPYTGHGVSTQFGGVNSAYGRYPLNVGVGADNPNNTSWSLVFAALKPHDMTVARDWHDLVVSGADGGMGLSINTNGSITCTAGPSASATSAAGVIVPFMPHLVIMSFSAATGGATGKLTVYVGDWTGRWVTAINAVTLANMTAVPASSNALVGNGHIAGNIADGFLGSTSVHIGTAINAAQAQVLFSEAGYLNGVQYPVTLGHRNMPLNAVYPQNQPLDQSNSTSVNTGNPASGDYFYTSLSAALSTTGPIMALPVNSSHSLAAGAGVMVQDGPTGTTQTFTTSAAVASGAPSIPVNPQTPNFPYAAGAHTMKPMPTPAAQIAHDVSSINGSGSFNYYEFTSALFHATASQRNNQANLNVANFAGPGHYGDMAQQMQYEDMPVVLGPQPWSGFGPSGYSDRSDTDDHISVYCAQTDEIWDLGGSVNYGVQALSLTSNATGGTAVLGFNGSTSAALAYNAAASDVATALNAMPSVQTMMAQSSSKYQGVYSAGTTYALNATVIDSSGYGYTSLVAGNVGNTPASSPTQWGPAPLLTTSGGPLNTNGGINVKIPYWGLTSQQPQITVTPTGLTGTGAAASNTLSVWTFSYGAKVTQASLLMTTVPNGRGSTASGTLTGFGIPSIAELFNAIHNGVPIPHGLAVILVDCKGTAGQWPAAQSDGGLTSSPLTEGQLMRLPAGASADIAAMPYATGRALAQAAQTYGMIFVDHTDSDVEIQCEDSHQFIAVNGFSPYTYGSMADFTAGVATNGIFNGTGSPYPSGCMAAFPWSDLVLLDYHHMNPLDPVQPVPSAPSGLYGTSSSARLTVGWNDNLLVDHWNVYVKNVAAGTYSLLGSTNFPSYSVSNPPTTVVNGLPVGMTLAVTAVNGPTATPNESAMSPDYGARPPFSARPRRTRTALA